MNKKSLVSSLYLWLKIFTVIFMIGFFGAIVVAIWVGSNFYVVVAAQTCYKLMMVNLISAWAVGRYKIMREYYSPKRKGGTNSGHSRV